MAKDKVKGLHRVDDAVQRAVTGRESVRTSPKAPRQVSLKKKIRKALGQARPGILKHLGIKGN